MAACKTPEHRPQWAVLSRRCNYSAFNGYRRTPSAYSDVICPVTGCESIWRTKADYVDTLPDYRRDTP